MFHLESPTIDGIQSDVPIHKPQYVDNPLPNSPECQQIIDHLQLIEHREGGYFKETDTSPFYMHNPYNPDSPEVINTVGVDSKEITRNYSTLIYYLITPFIPLGRMHRNRSRIIHILQKGSGQYVLVYPDGTVQTFRVGFDFAAGEVAQWVVPGGVWKASFISDKDSHLLISEVVVPGFEYLDHTFMEYAELLKLVGEAKAQELKWLLGSQ